MREMPVRLLDERAIYSRGLTLLRTLMRGCVVAICSLEQLLILNKELLLDAEVLRDYPDSFACVENALLGSTLAKGPWMRITRWHFWGVVSEKTSP